MTSTPDPTPTLADALAGLDAAARSAGLDAAEARREGEALAATVAAPATGAYLAWAEQVGGGRGSAQFFAAASEGRRWRSQPTELLSGLVIDGSAHATAYAEALVDVCRAATVLGDANEQKSANATRAAAVQLKSTQPPDPEPEPIPAAEPEPETGSRGLSTPERLLSTLSQLNTRQLREQGERIRDLGSSFLFGRRDDSGTGSAPAPRSSSNPFDLDNLPPDTPGAFAGFPGGPAADPDPRPSTPATPPAGAAGPGAPIPPAAAGAEPAPTAQAAAPSSTPTVVEPEPEPRSVEELLAELDGLIGLDRVKREIHRQVAVLKVERLRIKAGLKSPTITRHLIFTGNPGTGKTTVARLVAGIYRALGLLSKGQLVEVDRSELVAGYLGQTAIKTSEVVASATGGVLFIDEAYSLSAADDQYGQEAVDTLVKEMEDKRDDLVVIVAGYPAPMAEFIDHNPGLSSRFRTEIGFEDYTDDELVAIFGLLAANADYDVTDDCEKRFRMILAITPRGSTFGNGRFARNHLEAAIGRHAWRLRDVEDPTLEQLRELRAEDLDERDGDDPEVDAARAGDGGPEPTPHPLEVDGTTAGGTDEVEDAVVVPAPADEQLTPGPTAAEPTTAGHPADENAYPWWASEPGTGDDPTDGAGNTADHGSDHGDGTPPHQPDGPQ